MQINYWYVGGGVVALAGLYFIGRGGGASGEDSTDGVTGTPLAAPLFMASGGGTASAGTGSEVLGGDAWQPPKVPLSENPDYQIALVNKDVQLASINAAKELAKLTAGQLPPEQIPVLNSGSSKSEYRGSDIGVASSFIKQVTGMSNWSEEQKGRYIYQKALEKGVSTTEVAQAYSAATGAKVSPGDIAKWVADRGYKTL